MVANILIIVRLFALLSIAHSATKYVQPSEFGTIRNAVLDELKISEQSLTHPHTWQNCGDAIYKVAFGEDTFVEKCKTQFPAKIKPSFINSIKLRFKTFTVKMLMGLAALLGKRRPTHPIGIGAKGKFTVLNNKKIPSNSFFTPGRTFPVRIRQANLFTTEKGHDGSLDIRSLSIKLADDLEDSPYDIITNTGERTGFFNLDSFLQFMGGKGSDDKSQQLNIDCPSVSYASIGGFKRAPNSLNDLHYYSQTPVEFIADDGVKRFCRYRVVPYGHGPFSRVGPEASGLPDIDDQLAIYLTCTEKACDGKPREGDNRPADYLKQDFLKRVTSPGGLKYRLQIQFWESNAETDDREIFNSNKIWDHRTNPYHDLAVIELDEMLHSTVTEKMRFWIARMPSDTIKLVDAVSSDDYCSLNAARKVIYPFAQRVRTCAADSQKK